MRAMCPHCGGKGCDQPNCVDGYLQVSFAEGDWWTRMCLNQTDCGFVNGGRIYDGYPPESSGSCVVCGGPTDWIPFDEVPEDAGEGYAKNHLKFGIKSLEDANDALRKKLDELRSYAATWRLKQVAGPNQISGEEARLLRICRICYGPDSPTKEKGPFNLQEWAHRKCLEEIE